MRKWVMVFFDFTVLAGFGLYMIMTLWQLPDAMRRRLFVASLGALARLTGMAG